VAADPLSRVFSALADPTRRDMVARLTAADATVNELAEPYDVSVQAVSKHLKVLEQAGLVSRSPQGHRSPVHGFSPHFYTDFRTHPMRVADFAAPDWYAVLVEGLRTEQVIEAHWAAMGRYDPERRTKLVVDEKSHDFLKGSTLDYVREALKQHCGPSTVEAVAEPADAD